MARQQYVYAEHKFGLPDGRRQELVRCSVTGLSTWLWLPAIVGTLREAGVEDADLAADPRVSPVRQAKWRLGGVLGEPFSVGY